MNLLFEYDVGIFSFSASLWWIPKKNGAKSCPAAMAPIENTKCWANAVIWRSRYCTTLPWGKWRYTCCKHGIYPAGTAVNPHTRRQDQKKILDTVVDDKFCPIRSLIWPWKTGHPIDYNTFFSLHYIYTVVFQNLTFYFVVRWISGEVDTVAEQKAETQNQNTVGGEPTVHGEFPLTQGQSRYQNICANVMEQHFEISFSEDVNSMGVRLRLYGCERMRRERLIGEAVVSFANINLELENNFWLNLEPRANTTVSKILKSLNVTVMTATGWLQNDIWHLSIKYVWQLKYPM